MRNFQLTKFSALFTLVLFLSQTGLPEEKQISIYSKIANYSLPITEANGRDYVGIFELLDPLGKVSVKTDGSHWNVRDNDVECDFKKGNEVGRLQGQDIHLGSNFVLQNNRGFVPINSLSSLLPKLLGGPVTVNEAARRVFVGNVGVHFTAQIKNTAPSALVMDFTSQVNPAVSTEPGKLKLVFTHEPLMSPGTPLLTFASREIVSASYSENNGAAEITITGSVPLFASFSNNSKTITVGAAPQQAATKPATNPSQTNNSQALQPLASSTSHRYFVVIDASHGGDESGAAFSNQLMEKDVTLAIARQLRDELEARNVSVMLLRDSDITLATDQRASTTNEQHPAIYICLHASTQGRGVRLYTALIPAGDNHSPFLDWETAQAPFLSSSQAAATVLGSALQKSHIPVRQLTAPLRPLNSIVSSAVAVEVALPTTGSSTVISPAYEEFVAGSLADGIAALQNPPRGTQ